MAVPKQKQSHSRTNKRRSQHKLSAIAIDSCPQCGSPRRPHRVCATCGTYAGKEVIQVENEQVTAPPPASRAPQQEEHAHKEEEQPQAEQETQSKEEDSA